MIPLDAIRAILRCLDSALSTGFGRDDIRSWPSGVLDVCLGAGLLRPSDYRRDYTCQECPGQCSVELQFDDDSGPPTEAFFDCPYDSSVGRVRVPLDELATYSLSFGGLAAWVSGELGAPSSHEELVSDRLWWLGGPTIDRRRADVFLARGADWPDAITAFSKIGRLQESTLPLVLVPHQIPTQYPFGPSAKIASLVRLLRTNDSRLILDQSEISSLVGKSRVRRVQEVARFDTPPGTRWSDVFVTFVNDCQWRSENVPITAV